MGVAEKFYRDVAAAQKSGLATRVSRAVVKLNGNPCCVEQSDWGRVDLFLYWPARIWITRCQGCKATWTEPAEKKRKR